MLPMTRWIAAGGAFVVSLDSMVNIAFPAIAAGFALPPESMRWVIMCYVFTYSLVSFGGGALSDRVGHARGDLDRALEGASGVSDSPRELPLPSGAAAPTIATLRDIRAGEIAEGGTGAKQHESAPRGHVRAPEAPRVPGDTALAAAAADILRDGMPAIEWCYERSLRHHETLAGRLDLRIDVAPTGQVRRAFAGADELGDSDLVACIARRVEGWRFPQSRGAILSYPLVFEPRASR